MVQVDGAGRVPPSPGAVAPASAPQGRRSQVFETLFAELRAGGSARSERIDGQVKAQTDRRHDQVNAALKNRDKSRSSGRTESTQASAREERLERMKSANNGADRQPLEHETEPRDTAEPRDVERSTADRHDQVEAQAEPRTAVHDRVEQQAVEQSQEHVEAESSSETTQAQVPEQQPVESESNQQSGSGASVIAGTSCVSAAHPLTSTMFAGANTPAATGWQPVAMGATPMSGDGSGTNGSTSTLQRPGTATQHAPAPGETGSASFEKLLDAARPAGTGSSGTATAPADGAAAKAANTGVPTARGATAPNAAGSAHGTIHLNEAKATQELADVVRAGSANGKSHMTLRLDPPELGVLRIEMRMQEQALTVRMEAQTMAGHDALRSRLTDLRSALEQHGVQVQQVEVEYRPPAPPAQENGDRQNPTQNPYAGTEGWQGSAQRNTDGQGGRRPWTPDDAGEPAGVQTGGLESTSAAPALAGVATGSGVDLMA